MHCDWINLPSGNYWEDKHLLYHIKKLMQQKKTSIRKRSYTIILYSSQIKIWSLELNKYIKFCKSHERKSLLWLHSTLLKIKRYKRVSQWILFARCGTLSITARIMCVFESIYIWSDLYFIVDKKVKILHFHDEDKSWWSSI